MLTAELSWPSLGMGSGEEKLSGGPCGRPFSGYSGVATSAVSGLGLGALLPTQAAVPHADAGSRVGSRSVVAFISDSVSWGPEVQRK